MKVSSVKMGNIGHMLTDILFQELNQFSTNYCTAINIRNHKVDLIVQKNFLTDIPHLEIIK